MRGLPSTPHGTLTGEVGEGGEPHDRLEHALDAVPGLGLVGVCLFGLLNQGARVSNRAAACVPRTQPWGTSSRCARVKDHRLRQRLEYNCLMRIRMTRGAGACRWGTTVLALLVPCAVIVIACTNPAAARREKSAATKDETEKTISPLELRLRLQRFADGFSEALAQPLDELLAVEPDIAKRKIIIEAKYAYSSNALFIASGPYPAVSLLDMVVFVNLLRVTIEREGHEIVGDAIEPLARAARRYQKQVWELSALSLTPAQQAELRNVIDSWIAANPDRGYAEAVRFGEFASELDETQRKKAKGLLSQIRSATATADDALQLAERLTYFFQRAPAIWRLHGQLGYFEIMSQPEMRILLQDSSSIAASVDRLSTSVSEVSSLIVSGPTPDQEAFFANLEAGEKSVLRVMAEARSTLAAANELAGTMDLLATRFDLGGPAAADAEPFDIAVYEGTAVQIAATAAEFTRTIDTMNEFLASPIVAEQLPYVAAVAEAEGNRALRQVVWLIAGSVLATFCAMLAALLVYRILVTRLASGPDGRAT